jgi:hypothetical protein
MHVLMVSGFTEQFDLEQLFLHLQRCIGWHKLICMCMLCTAGWCTSHRGGCEEGHSACEHECTPLEQAQRVQVDDVCKEQGVKLRGADATDTVVVHHPGLVLYPCPDVGFYRLAGLEMNCTLSLLPAAMLEEPQSGSGDGDSDG